MLSGIGVKPPSLQTSVNNKYVHIDTRPQRGFKNSPDRLVIRGTNTWYRIIYQALYNPVLMRTRIVTDTSDVSSGVTFPPEENSIGVRGSALLAAGIKILRSRIVLVGRRKQDRGFLETAQHCAVVQSIF